MGRIDDIFAGLRADQRKALMPFLCAGHPTLEETREAILACEAAGASILEIGIPFSDPIADGPVIAGAMHEALAHGVTPRKVFDMVHSVRGEAEAGLVAMVSYSIVHRMGDGGAKQFIAEAAEAGFDGFIFPDMPAEESDNLVRVVDDHDVSLSMLVAPTTTGDRLSGVVERCRGFVYLMARVGITGTGTALKADGLPKRIEAVRALTDLPIACGFGISNADQVREVVKHADAAIVGSALVRRMGETEDASAEAGRFVRELAGGLG